MRRCRLCQSDQIKPLPFAVPSGQGFWYRCPECESDTNTDPYDANLYSDMDSYRAGYEKHSQKELQDDCRSNCDWITDNALIKNGNTFLDIGCGSGAALDVMVEKGWEAHGFEVSPVKDCRHPLVIAPVFHRWHWPKPFSAVMAREVFEHVEGPENFLHECHGATMPGGLFQVQTPKPIDYYYDHIYGRGHLFIASPKQLKKLLSEAMFDVIDSKEWRIGHAYLCKARS